MSHPTKPPGDLSPAEANLGKVLVLIHRVLPRLDDPARQAEVRSALTQAISLLDAARLAHSGPVVSPQLAAVIAAAVSVVLDQPYRLVSVEPVTVPVAPHLNVWAVEGRTQIFMSHKVR